MGNLTLVTFIVVILYIWDETDAFIEWGELLHLKFLRYKEYRDAKKSALSGMFKLYPDFLAAKHNNFFVRLVTCPICLGAWLNLIGICVFYHWTGWKNIALNIIITWLMFFGLKRLITKWNA